jgi:hypothetical protein
MQVLLFIIIYGQKLSEPFRQIMLKKPISTLPHFKQRLLENCPCLKVIVSVISVNIAHLWTNEKYFHWYLDITCYLHN